MGLVYCLLLFLVIAVNPFNGAHAASINPATAAMPSDQQNANAARARSAPGPQAPKMSPAEQSLKRWRYLGMSNSSSGISGLFDTGKGIQHIVLNGRVLEGWRLSSVTRELAMLSSNDGKTVAISVSKE